MEAERKYCSEIPQAFKKLENMRIFLQYDTGFDDPETEEAFEDSTSFGSWACDGTFKCSPLVFLSNIHFGHCDIALHDTKNIRPTA